MINGKLQRNICSVFYWGYINCIYKKSIISYFSVRFPENLANGEDTVFLLRFILHVNNYSIISDTFYYRRERNNSAIKNYSTDRFLDEIIAIEMKANIINNSKFTNDKYIYLEVYFYVVIEFIVRLLKLATKNNPSCCTIIAKKAIILYDNCLFEDDLYKIYYKKYFDCLKKKDVKSFITKIKNEIEISKNQKEYTFKTFDLLSIIKIKFCSKTDNSIKKVRFYIFLIQFLKIIKRDKKIYIKLFGFIPLLKISLGSTDKKSGSNIQDNYQLVLEKIKKKFNRNQKVNIAFLVNQKSKFIHQDLYYKFKNNNFFEVIILIKDVVVYENLNEVYNYFKKQNIRVELLDNNVLTSLNKLNIDILFYQQHWSLCKECQIENVSKFVLTCHVHYGICLSNNAIKRGENFYKNLFANFVINNESKNEYIKYFNQNLENIIVTGHPKLDTYYKYKGNIVKKYVIYAPHHSFENNNTRCATFDKNGWEILEFAKNHPEFSWIFKPHPRFKFAVVANKIMTENEIKNYYNEWSKIGIIHTDGNYFDIFKQARCMITDSISFLTEFLPTRQPVIHLRSKDAEEYDIISKQIIDHYYAVYNNNELQEYLNMILIDEKDPKKEERIEILNKLKLCESNASDNIINYLKKVIGI